MPRRNPERALARQARAAGISKAKYIETRRKALRQSAINQGWLASELAMTLADMEQIADDVYGNREEIE